MNRVLLVGSTGFLGTALSRRLLLQGVQVAGISKSIGFDICDFQSLAQLEGDFDTILHSASSFHNDDIDSIIQNELVNSIGSLNLCKLAAKKHCNYFVYISSISAIQDSANEYYNSYGISKRHAEENITFFTNRNNIKCLILRFSQIYDSYGISRHHQPFLFNLIRSVINDEQIYIPRSKVPMRNFIHIDDVCEVIVRSVDNQLSGLFHCVHPQSYSIAEIINIIGMVLNKTPKVSPTLSDTAVRSLYIPQDFTVYEKLSFSPKVQLVEAIKSIVAGNNV